MKKVFTFLREVKKKRNWAIICGFEFPVIDPNTHSLTSIQS